MARLTDLLNCVRVAEVRPHDIELLEARVIQSDHKDYPHNALHIFAENANASRYNLDRFQSGESNLYFIAAIDKLSKNVSAHKIREIT